MPSVYHAECYTTQLPEGMGTCKGHKDTPRKLSLSLSLVNLTFSLSHTHMYQHATHARAHTCGTGSPTASKLKSTSGSRGMEGGKGLAPTCTVIWRTPTRCATSANSSDRTTDVKASNLVVPTVTNKWERDVVIGHLNRVPYWVILRTIPYYLTTHGTAGNWRLSMSIHAFL